MVVAVVESTRCIPGIADVPGGDDGGGSGCDDVGPSGGGNDADEHESITSSLRDFRDELLSHKDPVAVSCCLSDVAASFAKVLSRFRVSVLAIHFHPKRKLGTMAATFTSLRRDPPCRFWL